MREYIAENNLIPEGAVIGAAVSGGADSMAMLHALMSLGYDVRVLHFEHGIRGEASAEDMRFVAEYCREREIPFFCERANVPGLLLQGESVESAARRLRYDFFARISEEQGITRIAAAHHADDNAETFFLNLMRGGGMTGLCGMSAFRPPNIIRPLLFAYRREIEEYCAENNIPFVTDATNASTDYTRNYIRHEILPRFREINPRAAEAIVRTQEILREENEVLAEYTEKEYARLAEKEENSVSLELCGLRELPAGMRRRVLRRAVAEVCSLRDIEKQHIDELCKLIETPETGKKFILPKKFSAAVSYNSLIIAEKTYKINKIEVYPLVTDGVTEVWDGMLLKSETVGQACFGKGSDPVQYFDGEALQGAVIRTRRQGDMFRALGAGGEKKLKDWMIDKKIPAEKRDGLILAAKGTDVLWIAGYAVSEKSKVRADSKHIIKLEFAKDKPEENENGKHG